MTLRFLSGQYAETDQDGNWNFIITDNSIYKGWKVRIRPQSIIQHLTAHHMDIDIADKDGESQKHRWAIHSVNIGIKINKVTSIALIMESRP